MFPLWVIAFRPNSSQLWPLTQASLALTLASVEDDLLTNSDILEDIVMRDETRHCFPGKGAMVLHSDLCSPVCLRLEPSQLFPDLWGKVLEYYRILMLIIPSGLR